MFKLLFIFQFFTCYSYGQKIAANNCDSTLLTKQEYDKCLGDSSWTSDIIIKTNYIINLKTELLPKFRSIRRNIVLSHDLNLSLSQLKKSYDTVLNLKLATFQKEMDRNQKYLQPKAYLSSMLSFQVFNFYPDIYAILLNDIHLQLTPKTDTSNLSFYKSHIDKIVGQIPSKLYQQIEVITKEIETENQKLMKEGFIPMFYGSIAEKYRTEYNIVNFLLWTE